MHAGHDHSYVEGIDGKFTRQGREDDALSSWGCYC
jgi:hypothetical protein